MGAFGYALRVSAVRKPQVAWLSFCPLGISTHHKQKHTMKAKELFREIFILAVRLFALILFYLGVKALTAPIFIAGDPPFHPLSAQGMIAAVIYFAAGFWLFKGPVIRWAYPGTTPSESKTEDVGGASPLKSDA